jgi:integrase
MSATTTKPKAKPKARTRASIKLSQSAVEKLKPEEKVTRVWDSTVPGFHVRICPGKKGKKVYCVSFQRPDGKKVNVTIGVCSAWEFDKAKEKAQELRKMHEGGKDPRAHVMAERKAGDLAALVEVWRENYKPKLKPRSRVSYESLIKTVILPALGTRTVKDLTYADVSKLHAKESKEHKTNANRSIAVLSRLFSIAEKEGWRPKGSNPCGDVEKNSETPRSRVFTAAELSRLEVSMRTLVQQEKLDASARDLVLFLACSGLRTSEAKGLCWKDVDIEANTMRFEDHKTSEDVGVKVLPLNTHLKEILKRRQVDNDSAYVWPTLRLEPSEPEEDDTPKEDAPLVGLAKMWKRICEAEGAKLEDVTPHDLRRTFMTTCTELGNPTAIGDTLLGHSLGKIQDTYVNLSPDGILAIASQQTSDWIAAGLAGANPKLGKKVKASKKAPEPRSKPRK